MDNEPLLHEHKVKIDEKHQQHDDHHQQQQQQNRRARSLHTYTAVLLLLTLSVLSIWISLHVFRQSSSIIRKLHGKQQQQQQQQQAVELNFLALGDWGRRGLYNQTEVARQMGVVGKKMGIEFVVSTGDNFYKNGLTGVGDPAFDASFSRVYTAPSLQKPWHSVLGNHDYHGDVIAQLDGALQLRDWRWSCKREERIAYYYQERDQEAKQQQQQENEKNPPLLELFLIDTVPFMDEYWVPDGKHHFDTRGLLPREDKLILKLEWLAKALNSSAARWKIVVGHHTIRSFGNHGESREIVQRVLPILEAHNVDMYLNGHDHCLQHVKRDDSRIHFVTSGGGSKAWKGIAPAANSNGLQFYYDGQGFVSVSVTEQRIHVLYYDIFGNILHKVQLVK